MLILTNYEHTTELNVHEKNGRVTLSAEIESFSIQGKESKTPCNYFVVEVLDKAECDTADSDNCDNTLTKDQVTEMKRGDLLNLKNAVPAKLIVCETLYETGYSGVVATGDDLVLAFGTKKRKERIKRREIDGQQQGLRTSRYTSPSQILPKINDQAEHIKDCYELELMFPSTLLNDFRNIEISDIALSPILMSYGQNVKYKTHFLLADCIIKVMDKNFITSDCLNDTGYECFYSFLKDHTEGKNLSPLGKDRLAVLCYILLLQIQSYVLDFDLVPSFGFTKTKIVALFKAIGCSYSKNRNILKLVSRPGITTVTV